MDQHFCNTRENKRKRHLLQLAIVVTTVLAIVLAFILIIDDERNDKKMNIYRASSYKSEKEMNIQDVINMNGGKENLDKSELDMTGIVRMGKEDAYLRYKEKKTVYELSGTLGEDIINSEEDAFCGLMRMKTIFRIPDDAIFYIKSVKNRPDDSTVYRFVQVFGNAEVEGYMFTIGVAPDGKISFLSGKYNESLSDTFSTDPALSEKEVIKRNKLKASPGDFELVITNKGRDNNCLAWRFHSSPLGRYLYYSTDSGELINEQDIKQE